MRLTCPSCGAQYEVPDDVIPDEGRDVQCSNCGNTWFQAKDTENSPEALAAEAASPKDAVWHPEVAADADDRLSINHPAQPQDTAPPAPPKRRELDKAVTDILREEAELEARAREAAAETFEEQTDLDLQEPEDEAAKRARQAQDRMRKLRGEDPETANAIVAAVAASERPQSRSDMLPDVDEINQTLRASSERREISSLQGELDDDEDDGNGFSRGFIFTVVLFAIGTALYVFAPQLGETIPQLNRPMQLYVALIDQARAGIDSLVALVVDMVSGETAEE